MTIGKERIQHLLVKKALVKMAIADLPVGEEMPEAEDHVFQRKFYDYTHLIPLHLKEEGYRIVLEHQSAGRYALDHAIKVKAYHGRREDGKDKHIGTLEASADIRGSTVTPELSHIKYKEHRGKGLGQALYTALFVHAKNKMGIGYVEGHEHSTMANRVHEKLSKIHGMKYKAKPNPRKLPGDEELDDAFGPYKYALKSEEELNKGMFGALAGLALAASPIQQVPQAIESASPKTTQTQTKAKWTPAGLHDELHPIAHLESNFGLKTEHAPNSLGSYHTAHGAVGLKVVTAHEEWKRNKDMKARFPGLEEPAHFEEAFKSNHALYNALASKHWKRIRKLTGSAEKAAYAWRFGLTACLRAKDEDIKNANYVKKFNSLLAQKQNVVVKSEKKLAEPLTVEHYSPVKGIETLDPAFQGSSKVKGVETARENRVPRVYAYIAGGEVEDSVAKEAQHKYSGVLPPETRLYDYGEDGEHLMDLQWSPSGHYDIPHLDDVEHELKSRGYHGYLNYNHRYPHAMALFYPLKVSYSGPYVQSLTKTEAGEPLAKAWNLTDDDIKEMAKRARVSLSGAPMNLPMLPEAFAKASPEQLKVFYSALVRSDQFWRTVVRPLLRADTDSLWEVERLKENIGRMEPYLSKEDIDFVYNEQSANIAKVMGGPEDARDIKDGMLKVFLGTFPKDKLPDAREIEERLNARPKALLAFAMKGPFAPEATKAALHGFQGSMHGLALHLGQYNLRPWELHFPALMQMTPRDEDSTSTLMSFAVTGKNTLRGMTKDDWQALADRSIDLKEDPGPMVNLADALPEGVTFAEPEIARVIKYSPYVASPLALRPEFSSDFADHLLKFFAKNGGSNAVFAPLMIKASKDVVLEVVKNDPGLVAPVVKAAADGRSEFADIADNAMRDYANASAQSSSFMYFDDDSDYRASLTKWARIRSRQGAEGAQLAKLAYKAGLSGLYHGSSGTISGVTAAEAINELSVSPDDPHGLNKATELAHEAGNWNASEHIPHFVEALKLPATLISYVGGIGRSDEVSASMPLLEKRPDFEDVMKMAVGKDFGDEFLELVTHQLSKGGIDKTIDILNNSLSSGDTPVLPRGAINAQYKARRIFAGLFDSPHFSGKHVERIERHKNPHLSEALLASYEDKNFRDEEYDNHHTIPYDHLSHIEEIMRGLPGRKNNTLLKIMGRSTPKYVNEEMVDFSIGTGKARKIRDLIVEQTQSKNPALDPNSLENREVQPKSLPPWTNVLGTGRTPSGNISAAKIQSWIDSQPKYKYGVSHSTWTGAQRHNQQNSEVFQLNLTEGHLDELGKDPAVLSTFNKFRKRYYVASHPATPWTLGWVRWTQKDNDFFIDEIQSDLGIHLVKDPLSARKAEAVEQLRRRAEPFRNSKTAEGLTLSPWIADYVNAPNDEAREKILDDEAERDEYLQSERARYEEDFPKAHLDRINQVLYQGKHPSILLFEAFNQWLRDKGHVGAKISIHDVIGKAHRSGLKLDRIRVKRVKDGKGGIKVQHVQDIPGHQQLTYGQIPKDAGWTPSVYGARPGQDGPTTTITDWKVDKDTGEKAPVQRQSPTHEGEIHKSEELAQFYADSEGVIFG